MNLGGAKSMLSGVLNGKMAQAPAGSPGGAMLKQVMAGKMAAASTAPKPRVGDPTK